MKNINASQLALLLDIPKKDAAKKITVAIERSAGNNSSTITEYMVQKNPSIPIKNLSVYMGIDLHIYLNDIKNNFLKNPSTGRWILDYPATKIKPNKKTGTYPRTISIPGTLRSLLSDEQISLIVQKWYEKYRREAEELGITFRG